MEAFTSFLASNYVWFVVVTLILLFALVGYLIDVKDIKKYRRDKSKDDDFKVVDFTTVDNSKSLNESIKEEAANTLNLDEYKNNTAADTTPVQQEAIVQEQPAVLDDVQPQAETVNTLNLDEYQSNKETEVAQPVQAPTETLDVEELPDLDEGKKFESEF